MFDKRDKCDLSVGDIIETPTEVMYSSPNRCEAFWIDSPMLVVDIQPHARNIMRYTHNIICLTDEGCLVERWYDLEHLDDMKKLT